MADIRGRYREYHFERRKLLRRVGLTFSVLALTLFRVTSVGSVFVPLAVFVVTVVVVWLEEDVVGPYVERRILTACVLVQALAYADHYGLVMTVVLASVGLVSVWGRTWRGQWSDTIMKRVVPAPLIPRVMRKKQKRSKKET